MKIAFDCRYVRTEHHDGISRFSARLVEHLIPLVNERGDELVMLISDEKQLNMLPDLPYALISSPTSIREPRVAYQINKLNPDLVFSPMQTIGSRGRKYRLILTVHDLIYYSHPTPPRDLSWPIRLLWRLYHTAWWPQRLLLAKSDAVVAVSRTTKNLITENKLTTKPVYVVHNAADLITDSEAIPTLSERSQSLVYMGSFMPYKNVETIVQAASLLPQFTLHLLSKISNHEMLRLSSLAPQAKLHFHNGITDEEYFDLLSHATALVSASKEEGFGIPVIEAMNLGTPVVISDIPIFHEIGGEAALYAATESPEDFAQQIHTLEDPAIWVVASRRSSEQAQQFSWSKSAEELFDVFVEVASTKPKG